MCLFKYLISGVKVQFCIDKDYQNLINNSKDFMINLKNIVKN